MYMKFYYTPPTHNEVSGEVYWFQSVVWNILEVLFIYK